MPDALPRDGGVASENDHFEPLSTATQLVQRPEVLIAVRDTPWTAHAERTLMGLGHRVRMPAPMQLSVQVREYSWESDAGWMRSKIVQHRSVHVDWVIDDVPLRRLGAPEDQAEAADGVTPVGNPDAGVDLAFEYLRTLLGIATTDSWRFADGRVALLCCPVDFDLDCGTLTAELVINDDDVIWRRVGYQVSRDPFTPEQLWRHQDLRFDRRQYETTLNDLLREVRSPMAHATE